MSKIPADPPRHNTFWDDFNAKRCADVALVILAWREVGEYSTFEAVREAFPSLSFHDFFGGWMMAGSTSLADINKIRCGF